MKIKEWDDITKKGSAINSAGVSFLIESTDKLDLVKSKHFFELLGEIESFFIDDKRNSSKQIYDSIFKNKYSKITFKTNKSLIALNINIEKRLAKKTLKLTTNVKSFHYNLLMNNIMIEINRQYKNIINSTCQVCDKGIRDYEHLLIHCTLARIVNDLDTFESTKTMRSFDWENGTKISTLKLI